jgi:hypothetical protein
LPFSLNTTCSLIARSPSNARERQSQRNVWTQSRYQGIRKRVRPRRRVEYHLGPWKTTRRLAPVPSHRNYFETYGDKMTVVHRGPTDFPAHVNAGGLEQPRISYSKVNIYTHELPPVFGWDSTLPAMKNLRKQTTDVASVGSVRRQSHPGGVRQPYVKRKSIRSGVKWFTS